MTTLGVTGTFGSGKSTFAKYLAGMGAVLVDADKISHDALEPNGAAHDKTITVFGESIKRPDGTIDRKRLAAMVFKDPAALERLTDLIHPIVVEKTFEQIKAVGDQLVVIDVPLLFEIGMDRFCEATVALTVPDSVREERLKNRGFSPEQMRERDHFQWPDKKKQKEATYVVENNGSFENLRQEAETIFQDFVKRFGRGGHG